MSFAVGRPRVRVVGRVDLGPPPALSGRPKAKDFKEWLLGAFWKGVCSYCLLQNRSLEVEHYVPKGFAPTREHDPTNLLLGCSSCNGPGGKWDYHPDDTTRLCQRTDTTGYHVIDVRADDFATLFAVEPSGEIIASPGDEYDRAVWNIALLGLYQWDAERRELLELLAVCEDALALVDEDVPARTLDRLIPLLARRFLFFEILEIPVSQGLAQRVKAKREQLRRDDEGTASPTPTG